MSIGVTPGGVEIAAWIFKARPDMWDVGDWMASGEPAGSWRMADGPRVALVAPGQRCFLWVTGPAGGRPTPGIWAWGTITGEVFDQRGDPDDPRWTDREAQRQERPFAPVDLHVLDEPIPRAELRADPRFSQSEILRAPRVGNPVVLSARELAVLDEWLAGRGAGSAPMTPDELVVLCVNAGSSTVKVALFAVGAAVGDERELWRWDVEGADADPGAAFDALGRSGMPVPDVVGHRVVHGGTRHTAPTLVDDAVLDDLRELIPLAPLHEPAAIAGIEAARVALAGVPQVACFDTAFHRTLPEEAADLPLPERFWLDGVRRYGFHGLSYEYVVEHVGAEQLGRAVLAHLGNGASLCAVRDGRSIDTTMGFTPTGGIVMGTRSGDLDPGVLVHLLTEPAGDGTVLDGAAVDDLVNHQSGLLGLSGSSSDMRSLLAARAAGDRRAELAVRVFCRTIRKQVGAYAAVLGGLDTLVFTGGIGEHATEVRDEICDGLGFLEPFTVLVVATDEDRMIARHAAAVVRAR